MWNSCESHIPLNGCKVTNFSAHFQIFLSFSFHSISKNIDEALHHWSASPFVKPQWANLERTNILSLIDVISQHTICFQRLPSIIHTLCSTKRLFITARNDLPFNSLW